MNTLKFKLLKHPDCFLQIYLYIMFFTNTDISYEQSIPFETSLPIRIC